MEELTYAQESILRMLQEKNDKHFLQSNTEDDSWYNDCHGDYYEMY